jgi:[acyl-carrier-protein] S-malonyltransferase
MGRELLAQPEAQEVVAEAERLGWKWSVPELTAAELRRTAIAQPAIFLVEWAAFLAARRRGEPVAVAGHSLGEFAALAAAEVLTWPEAFRLVLRRGELMEEAAESHAGGMVAVLGLPQKEVAAIAQACGCFVANINGPTQVVLAGVREALACAEKLAAEQGAKTIGLPVAGAFHSPLMAGAAARFAAALDGTEFRPPKRTFVSSTTGQVEHDPQRIREILKVQMTSPVQWVGAVEGLAALGVEEAWEIGPGQVLTRLGRRITERIRFRTMAEVSAYV